MDNSNGTECIATDDVFLPHPSVKLAIGQHLWVHPTEFYFAWLLVGGFYDEDDELLWHIEIFLARLTRDGPVRFWKRTWSTDKEAVSDISSPPEQHTGPRLRNITLSEETPHTQQLSSSSLFSSSSSSTSPPVTEQQPNSNNLEIVTTFSRDQENCRDIPNTPNRDQERPLPASVITGMAQGSGWNPQFGYDDNGPPAGVGVMGSMMAPPPPQPAYSPYPGMMQFAAAPQPGMPMMPQQQPQIMMMMPGVGGMPTTTTAPFQPGGGGGGFPFPNQQFATGPSQSPSYVLPQSGNPCHHPPPVPVFPGTQIPPRMPQPHPLVSSSSAAANLTNSTGGTGCEPGYNYYFPPEHTKIHVIKSAVAPWRASPGQSLDYVACHVPTHLTLGDLMKGFGALNPSNRKNKITEVIQGANGKWHKSVTYQGTDKEDMKRTLGSIGWDRTRNGRVGGGGGEVGKPVVWIWVTKDS